jgi:hypothetical protein
VMRLAGTDAAGAGQDSPRLTGITRRSAYWWIESPRMLDVYDVHDGVVLTSGLTVMFPASWTLMTSTSEGRAYVLGEFEALARRPAENVVVLADEAARVSAWTVNRMLSGVVGFYELQARRGSTLAKDLIVETRSGRGGSEPFLHGIARSRSRGRAVRLPERRSLPSTLSLEHVASVIDCQGAVT